MLGEDSCITAKCAGCEGAELCGGYAAEDGGTTLEWVEGICCCE